MLEHKTLKQNVTFSFAAPEAQTVAVVGDFTEWQKAPVSLKKGKGGLWKKIISLSPGRHEYRLLVDGQWCDDPNCREHQPNQFGSQNCVCVVDGG